MSSWRMLRVGALVAILVVVAAWAGGVHRIRSSRVQWDRPVEVAVVLLSPTGIDAMRVSRLRDGLGELEARLSAEFARYRGGGTPFSFKLVGPVPFNGPIAFTPDSDGFIDRAAHSFRLWKTLRGVHAAAGFDPKPYDARIYLLLEPAAPGGGGERTFAEGAGAAGGDVGFVRAVASSNDAVLALTAVAHELFHCLGATDKYDAAGHAVVPDGLAEPDLSPQYPQQYAEWMVGETRRGRPRAGSPPRSPRSAWERSRRGRSAGRNGTGEKILDNTVPDMISVEDTVHRIIPTGGEP